MTKKENKRITGTIGLENQLTNYSKNIRYDEKGITVFKHKEILATIMKYSVPEYEQYSLEEITGFIESNSITSDTAIAPDMDSRIIGDDTVHKSTGEANLAFDIKFRILKPVEKPVHLHVEMELQGKYNPGYPIEKRGIYNLSRMISSQLEVINAKTNYNKLEKAYSIFICVGNVPKYLWNTVSYYEFANKRNIGNVEIKPENYDLMGLVVIRIGERIDENISDIIRFLHGLFYDTNEVEQYIDFSGNEQFRKELGSLAITGEHLIEYGKHLKEEEMQAELEKEKKARKEAENENRVLREQLAKLKQ